MHSRRAEIVALASIFGTLSLMAQSGTILATGTFHGVAHATSGRATVYSGTEGDQNYSIPANTDLSKYKAVSIFCERFNANFGTAPLEK